MVKSLCRIVVAGCAVVATAVLVPATIGALWDWTYQFRYAEKWAEYERIKHRNDDATLSLCATFGDLYDKNPSWGPLTPEWLEICTAALNRR